MTDAPTSPPPEDPPAYEPPVAEELRSDQPIVTSADAQPPTGVDT